MNASLGSCLGVLFNTMPCTDRGHLRYFCSLIKKGKSVLAFFSSGHNASVRQITHSPTGPAFITCSDDFRARFWYRKATTDWRQHHYGYKKWLINSTGVLEHSEPCQFILKQETWNRKDFLGTVQYLSAQLGLSAQDAKSSIIIWFQPWPALYSLIKKNKVFCSYWKVPLLVSV